MYKAHKLYKNICELFKASHENTWKHFVFAQFCNNKNICRNFTKSQVALYTAMSISKTARPRITRATNHNANEIKNKFLVIFALDSDGIFKFKPTKSQQWIYL